MYFRTSGSGSGVYQVPGSVLSSTVKTIIKINIKNNIILRMKGQSINMLLNQLSHNMSNEKYQSQITQPKRNLDLLNMCSGLR